MMKCLMVEDDALYAEQVINDLEQAFPALRGGIELIANERALRERVALPQELAVDFAILDVMIHWADPNEENLPDSDTVRGGYFRAGIRCMEEIRRHPHGGTLPVVIHSALTTDKLRKEVQDWGLSQEHLIVTRKRGDHAELFDAVTRLVPGNQPPNL